MFDRRLLDSFLRLATRDAMDASNMRDAARFSDQGIGYHLQQAAEKSLKAWLMALGEPAPRTHELQELLIRLETLGVNVDRYRDVTDLFPYATRFRYEIEDPNVPLDRERYCKLVDSLLQHVEKIASMKL
jgi:HEPN domain-containing protein